MNYGESDEVVSLSGWDVLYRSERLNRAAWSNQPIIGETKKLRDLCLMANPQVIVELGSRYGGTALAFHDAAPSAFMFCFDKDFMEGDEIVDWSAVHAAGHKGYEDEAYHPKRSWFESGFVQFIKADFVAQIATVKKEVDSARTGRMFLFVDGAHGQKPHDAKLYADWLVPGDILAVNNFGDEWTLPEIEDWLLPNGFERFEFEWCEKVGMMLTRAWGKK